MLVTLHIEMTLCWLSDCGKSQCEGFKKKKKKTPGKLSLLVFLYFSTIFSLGDGSKNQFIYIFWSIVGWESNPFASLSPSIPYIRYEAASHGLCYATFEAVFFY